MGNRTEPCPPGNQRSPQTFHMTQVNLHMSDLEKSKGRQTQGYLWQWETSRGTGSTIHFYGAAPEGQQAGQEAAESTRELDPPGEVCSREGTLLYLGHGCWCVTRGLVTGVAWFLILYVLHPTLEGTLCSRLCFGGFSFLVSLQIFNRK